MKTIVTAYIAGMLVFLAVPAQAQTPTGHERIVARANAITMKVEMTLTRFENIASRLESRIAKLKAAQVDVAAAEQRLAETKVALAKARSSFANLSEPTPASPVGNPPEAAALLRLELRDLYTELQLVHQSLVHIISLLKGAAFSSSVAAQ